MHFLWSLDRPMVRLDAPVAASDSRLGDVMGLHAAGRSPVAEAILEETIQEVEQLIDRNFEVDWRAAEILRMRFGIGLDEPMTLDAVGREFNVTKERIRQIEKKSLEALRSTTTPEEIRELLRGLAS